MNTAHKLIAALTLASATLASPALLAADISTAPQALSLVDDSAFFGDAFAGSNSGNTFSDQFTFTVSGTPVSLDAIVSSISRTASTGLDITGLALYTGAGTLVSSGTSLQSGAIDVWTLSGDSLAAGNYYVQVSGSLISATSGAFGGAAMLAPVPEPVTYGMLLAGLGLVGFMARRRKA